MSNMSYCRFENTSKDLDDCLDALKELVDNNGVNEYDETLSSYEKSSAILLVHMCSEIAEQQEEFLEMLNKIKEN